ncbi:MAG: proline dehydrogenase family protein [Ignavibacteriales bacterium]
MTKANNNWYNKEASLQSPNSRKLLLEKFLFKIARNWISGNTYEDALSSARISNGKGMSAILNFLGEDTTDERVIQQTVNEYIMLLDLLESNSIDGCISVKPTQVGLRIGVDSCLFNLRQIAEKAKNLDRFMWLDIESYPFVEDTIAIYLKLLRDYKEIGVALQSYLKRSSSDLLHLLEQDANIRLVKGAYTENDEIAFRSMDKINSNFSELMKTIFNSSDGKRNPLFAIATHDPRLVNEAIELSKKSRTVKRKFEFQLLKGVSDEMKTSLVKQGFRVCEYLPYGNQWLPYSVRRIKERKRNILLLARSLIPS